MITVQSMNVLLVISVQIPEYKNSNTLTPDIRFIILHKSSESKINALTQNLKVASDLAKIK